MKCGYPNCRYNSKRFGVCGKHKNSAYEYDSTEKDYNEYILDLKKYEEIMIKYKNATDELKNQGLNILSIQSCYNNNLCVPLIYQFPQHLKGAGEALEESLNLIKLLQIKYNDIVISNATSKIQHRVLDPKDNCCLVCNLGKVR